MDQKVLMFGEYYINKNAFHKNGRPISIDKVDIRRIVLSSKHWYASKGPFKYFTGYIDETNIFPVPLYIKLLQMNGYVKYFEDSNKYNDKEVCFMVKKYEINRIKYGIELKIYLEKSLIVNQCIIINTL